MKKLILLTLLITSTSLFAQNSYFGVRGGLNSSKLRIDGSGDENKARFGFAVGAFAEYKLDFLLEYLSIAPELQWSSEGSKDKDLRVDYVQLPVLFKYEAAIDFSAMLGPQLGWKVHEHVDVFKDFSFSMVAGAQWLFTDEFFVDVRYTHGFSDVFKNDLGVEGRNSSIQLGVGIRIY